MILKHKINMIQITIRKSLITTVWLEIPEKYSGSADIS